MPPNVQNARDDLGDLAELLMVEGLDAQLASRQRLLVHERLERDRCQVAYRDLVGVGVLDDLRAQVGGLFRHRPS